MLRQFGIKPWELEQLEGAFVDELLIVLRAEQDERKAQEKKQRRGK